MEGLTDDVAVAAETSVQSIAQIGSDRMLGRQFRWVLDWNELSSGICPLFQLSAVLGRLGGHRETTAPRKGNRRRVNGLAVSRRKERSVFRTSALIFGLIATGAAYAQPTDVEISSYMACMRAVVPVLRQHGRIEDLATLIGTASEACAGNMPDRLDREESELIILEGGLAADGSDAPPEMGTMDGPSIWYPDVPLEKPQ